VSRGRDSLPEVLRILWLSHPTIMSSPLLDGGEQAPPPLEICTVDWVTSTH